MDGAEMIKEEVRDAGLIAAAQRVEHYEMAGSGCARIYAQLLGDKKGRNYFRRHSPKRRLPIKSSLSLQLP